MELKLRQQEIIKEFATYKTWDERYKHIIDLGKRLEPMAESLKNEDVKVRGCQAQVWLVAKKNPDGKIQFVADSDALIVRGLVSLLIRVYSDATAEEILNTPPEFITELGFDSHLSPSRANGLMSMIKQMKYYALAYSTVA